MEILTIVLAVLGFGLSCFKLGYSIGKDVSVSRHDKSRPVPTKMKRL